MATAISKEASANERLNINVTHVYMEFVTDLYQQLEKQLYEIEMEPGNVRDIALKSYKAADAAMNKLKAYINSYAFKTPAEEIAFFKKQKPKFYSWVIYYAHLFEVETNRPEGAIKFQRKYLNKRLAVISTYGEQQKAFYKYYRSGADYLDHAYFMRDKFDLLVGFDMSYLDCDPCFCSSHDFIAANLLANEKLSAYLNTELQKLRPQVSLQNEYSFADLGLSWVETKAAFIELLYGLQSIGAFYNTKTRAKADMKDVAYFFQAAFNIDLGNFYRTFQEIRIRKKNRVAFIDKVREVLLKRMDETDDNFN